MKRVFIISIKKKHNFSFISSLNNMKLIMKIEKIFFITPMSMYRRKIMNLTDHQHSHLILKLLESKVMEKEI